MNDDEWEELEEQSPNSNRASFADHQLTKEEREKKLNTAAYVLQKFKESGKLYYRPDEWFPPDPKLLDQRNEKTVKLFKREEWADSALFDIVQQLFEDEEYYHLHQQESNNNASFDYNTIQAHVSWAEYKKQKKTSEGYHKTINRVKKGVEEHWNQVPRVKSNKDQAKRAEAVRKVAEQQRSIIEREASKSKKTQPQWNSTAWQELFSKSVQQKRKERKEQEVHEAKVLDAQRRAQRRVSSTKKKEEKQKEQIETLEKDVLNLRRLRISAGILESASRVNGLAREDYLQIQREMAQLPLEEREKYFQEWVKVFSQNTNRNILAPELKITTVEEVDKLPQHTTVKKGTKNYSEGSFRPSSAPQMKTTRQKSARPRSTPSSPLMHRTEIEIVISSVDEDDEFEQGSQESEGFAPWNTRSP